MEKYIILVNCELYCNDFYCTIYNKDNIFTAELTNEFHSDSIITATTKIAFYAELAQYILNYGPVISIIPISEKHQLQIFQSFIRIEEIKRHLIHIKKNLL
jgi:hypothetical protein